MFEYIVEELLLHKLVETYCEKNLLLYSPLPDKTESIVRCKDCKYSTPDNWSNTPDCAWCDYNDHAISPDEFCSWGKRKEE